MITMSPWLEKSSDQFESSQTVDREDFPVHNRGLFYIQTCLCVNSFIDKEIAKVKEIGNF